MKILLKFFLAGLLTIAVIRDTTAGLPSSFALGSQFYHLGEYQKSAEVLRSFASSNAPSPGLLQNLGNAEWSCSNAGPAILAWERALWLDPRQADARANLRFARKSALLETPDLAWYEICSTWLPVNVWAWLACGSFWLAAALVFLPGILRWRKTTWQQALAAASFAVFLLTIPAMFGVFTRAQIGVVLAQNAPLRLTPTAEAQFVARLAEGETVRLERERGQYLFIRASGMSGWIERAQFALISKK